jgi:hypothetical protein
VVEQLAHGDAFRRRGVGEAEPRQVAAHGLVQVDAALLHQLHHGQRREGLAERADDEGRLRRHGPPAGVGDAEGRQVDDPVAVHDAQRQAGDSRGPHLRLDVGVDGG